LLTHVATPTVQRCPETRFDEKPIQTVSQV